MNSGFLLLTLAFSAIALAFLLVPLLARRHRSETGHPSHPLLPVVLAIIFPLAALGLYYRIGTPSALAPAAPAPANPDNAPTLQEATAGLAQKLQQHPDDLGGWMLLGRAYKTMEQFAQARDALAQAYRLAPGDPDVLAEYAEALTLASTSHRVAGEPAQLLERALVLSPNHPRALWLFGIQAYQEGDFSMAVNRWDKLLSTLAPGDPIYASVQQHIADARVQAGGDAPLNEADADESATKMATASSTLTLQVSVAGNLRDRVAPTDTVFVFARAANGPRMPIAIRRLAAASLPATVALSDSDSMLPAMKLSSVPKLVVGARISRSGNATPQSGDLETLSVPFTNGRREPLMLTIDRIVP